MSIRRVLVANRGEIAVRVIKACNRLGVDTVAAVSEVDRNSLAARLAGRTVCVGGSRSTASYLNANALVTVAVAVGADAIHPGYGFLAENANFARLCEENGITFIGPPAECISEMGNKLRAREIAEAAAVPLAQGSNSVRTVKDAERIAEEVGYPVLLKAAAGGGGRGIRVVSTASGLKSAFESASAEALSSFADNAMFLERYIQNARHVEVQVLADHHGYVVHLGDRDCSPQRRYQKMVEEAPAANLPDALRANMQKAAVSLACGIGYRNAGTVEFIVDQDRGEFYFMEMNTRIQVEHPVTEMVTGIDIVEQQIQIAAGEPLRFDQAGVKFCGHAVEVRINAESPLSGFRPSPGEITCWTPPEQEGLRVDSHCYEGYVIPPFYDSLMAKLIVSGENRSAAISKMLVALESFNVGGVDTTIPFLRYALSRPEFSISPVNTRWLEQVAEQYFQDQF